MFGRPTAQVAHIDLAVETPLPVEMLGGGEEGDAQTGRRIHVSRSSTADSSFTFNIQKVASGNVEDGRDALLEGDVEMGRNVKRSKKSTAHRR